MWKETFEKELLMPELAMIRFVVFDEDVSPTSTSWLVKTGGKEIQSNLHLLPPPVSDHLP